MKRLVLIDANALIHRSFHALPPLTTKKGELVNAVYGFTSVLLRVLKELKPDYIVTAFDLPKPTFRHLEYEAYKATRPKTAEELIPQFSKVKEVVKAFDIPIMEKEGFEADDIIATITKKTGEDIEDIIVTGDLDALQLVDKNTKVYTLKKGITDTVIYDEKAVRERFELEPGQLVDYKGLKGDPSDNIPGVPGVGEKTAIELLKKYKTIENLYKNLEKGEAKDISDALRKKLLDNKNQAFFSKKLATVRYDVPIKFNLDACRVETYNPEEVIKLFQDLDFKSLISRLPVQQQLISATKEEKPVIHKLKDIERAYKEKILSKKTYQLEKELAPVLENMEQTGIKLDIDFLQVLSKKINAKIQELEEKIYKLSGVNFNINSSQQLSEILFKKLNISFDGLKKTPGGVISTAAPELIKLKGKHKIIDLILEYRELMKLKTTYVDALPKLVDQHHRIHTDYHQLGTATGRLSSSDPNLQNIPIRGNWGKDLRKAFIAEDGYKLISADYSQIELRIAACLAKDKKMIKAFKDNQDIHKITAAEVNNVSLKEVTDKMRYEAKALNFGVLYGMSVVGFSEAAGISRDRAKKFIDEYMRDFSGIAKYVEKTKKEAKKKGYVETVLGRRRYLPQINSSDFLLRRASERMAINMPIQGCLPWSTKVLTSEGYKPIGELYELRRQKPKFVWNGSKWVKYKALNRGEAELAEIEFSNGQIFRCDVRHKVLVIKNHGYQWREFSELKSGMKACFSIPRVMRFKKPPQFTFKYIPKNPQSIPLIVNKLTPEFWYWIGYYYGDGYISKRDKWGRYDLSFFFGGGKIQRADGCCRFFKSLNLNPRKRIIKPGQRGQKNKLSKVEVTITSQGLGRLYERLGINIKALAHTKRLPAKIFSEGLENRIALIRGVMDSDGCYGINNSRYVPNLHLCQRFLLEDIQLLLRTLGVESRLRGPYHSRATESYRLDIPRRGLFKALSMNAARFTRDNTHSVPKFLKEELKSSFSELSPKFFKTRSDYIVYRRLLKGGSSSIYHFIELLERNKLKLKSPLYTWYKIKRIRRLNKKETTYTLSVEGESHRFDSEGVISKNTAADIMKVAMIRISKNLLPEARLLLQVHDELVLEVKEDEIKETAKIVEDVMENVLNQPIFKEVKSIFKIPLKVDIKIGDNWGDLTEVQS